MMSDSHQASPLLPPGPESDAKTLVHALPEPELSERPVSKQRRKARRVGVCLGVGLRSETSNYTGFTSDLSEGGLFVATHMLQAIGSEVELSFTLPEGPELNARGIVRWVRDPHDFDPCAPPGMGVQFTALDAISQALISSFIELREPQLFE